MHRWTRLVIVAVVCGVHSSLAAQEIRARKDYENELVAPESEISEDFRITDGNRNRDFCARMGTKAFVSINGDIREITTPFPEPEPMPYQSDPGGSHNPHIIPQSIADNGAVLCVDRRQNTPDRSFIWRPSDPTMVLGNEEHESLSAIAMSANGQYVTGRVSDDDAVFRWHGGEMSLLSVPDRFESFEPRSVANDGTIVGWCTRQGYAGGTLVYAMRSDGTALEGIESMAQASCISADGKRVFGKKHEKEIRGRPYPAKVMVNMAGVAAVSMGDRAVAIAEEPSEVIDTGETGAYIIGEISGDDVLWEQGGSVAEIDWFLWDKKESGGWIRAASLDETVAVTDNGIIYCNVKPYSDSHSRDDRVVGCVLIPKRLTGDGDGDGAGDSLPGDDDSGGDSEAPKNIIFITHGWTADATGWASDLRDTFIDELQAHGVADEWRVLAFDWHQKAGDDPTWVIEGLSGDLYGVNWVDFESFLLWLFKDAKFLPTKAAENARELGKEFGEIFDDQDLETVHLVGHSAGSHFVEAICEEVNDGDTYTHLTLLDAFMPNDSVGSQPFGDNADFAEHYRDSRTLELPIGKIQGFVEGRAGPTLSFCWNTDASSFHSRLEDMEGTNETSTPAIGEGGLGVFSKWSAYHAWPHQWYRNSLGSGLGLDLAPAFAGEQNHDEYPRERDK